MNEENAVLNEEIADGEVLPEEELQNGEFSEEEPREDGVPHGGFGSHKEHGRPGRPPMPGGHHGHGGPGMPPPPFKEERPHYGFPQGEFQPEEQIAEPSEEQETEPENV